MAFTNGERGLPIEVKRFRFFGTGDPEVPVTFGIYTKDEEGIEFHLSERDLRELSAAFTEAVRRWAL